MHTFLFRLNALATFAISTLAALCAVAAFTDVFHASNPVVNVSLARVERLHPVPSSGNDEAFLAFKISADLSSLFSWNTKQLFVWLDASYETPRNVENHVSLWDRIITSREEAVLSLPYVRNKYKLVDQGNYLRNRALNLTMHWNVMPSTGALWHGSKTFSGFRLPKRYTNDRN